LRRRRIAVKTVAVIALGVLLSAVSAHAGEGKYRITGDLSASYSNGDMVIWTPRPKGEGKPAGMAAAGMTGMAMSSAAGSSGGGNGDAALEKSLNVLARAPLKDGKFVIEGVIDTPKLVHFYVLNATSSDGYRRAPTKGQTFVLEPGELTMTMNAQNKFTIEGGNYNDAVFNSWRQSVAYKEVNERFMAALQSPKGQTEADSRARSERITSTQSELLKLETNGYKHTATTHPEFIARKLAMDANWLRSGWELDALRGMEKMEPENVWVKEQIAQETASMERRKRQRETSGVGSDIKDFTARNLDGKDISLQDVRSRNKYLLVELWASWCGPCRAEIPHMKQAYEQYHKKGFEIFSFTIDDSRQAWEKASREEKIPWIDTGFGSKSEPKKMYEVAGVPANYLVDAASGKVIARDLRGYKLDEKLAELFDKPAAGS
jgi:thiol-disulfide isomerase/thioredoxin